MIPQRCSLQCDGNPLTGTVPVRTTSSFLTALSGKISLYPSPNGNLHCYTLYCSIWMRFDITIRSNLDNFRHSILMNNCQRAISHESCTSLALYHVYHRICIVLLLSAVLWYKLQSPNISVYSVLSHLHLLQFISRTDAYPVLAHSHPRLTSRHSLGD